MNSSEVAKLLGVSVSTIQRWVKQLELPMERNERGHYLFKEEDIEMLKAIHKQIQQGVLIQDIAPKKQRTGTIKPVEHNEAIEKLTAKITELESKLNAKADSVASYQLLQHRREIDELQTQVRNLLDRISTLENQLSPPPVIEKPLVHDQTNVTRKAKKKNIVSSLFGF